MKGQQISEWMTDIDDDLIIDAMPPAYAAGAGSTDRGGKPLIGRIIRVMNSGVTAAVLSLVVAGSVIAGLVLMGQNGEDNMAGDAPNSPVGDSPVGDGPNLQPSVGDEILDAEADETEQTAEENVTTPVAEPEEVVTDPAEDAPVDEEIAFDRAPVRMHLQRFLYYDQFFGLYTSYCICSSFTPATPDGTGYDADGEGAYSQLPVLAADFKGQAAYIGDCEQLVFRSGHEGISIRKILICHPQDYTILYSFEETATVDLALLQEAGEVGYFIVVETYHDITNEAGRIEGSFEYPIYVTLVQNAESTDETSGWTSREEIEGEEIVLSPIPVAGYPSVSVVFDAAAVDKALFGGVDPDNQNDMEVFAEIYASSVSPADAAAMIRLLRSVPIPLHKGCVPSVTYFVGDTSLIFNYKDETGTMSYQYEMILDSAEANEVLYDASLLEAPIKVNRYARILGISTHWDKVAMTYMEIGGVLAIASVWDTAEELTGHTWEYIYKELEVYMVE